MEILLATVLMLSQGQDWINPDVQNCIWNITNTYFNGTNLLYLGEEGFELKVAPKKIVYTYTRDVPPHLHCRDTVMIHRNLSGWKRSELRGRVLLVTQTLDGVNTLWTKLRLLNLVVLLVDEEDIKLYTWFPYNPKYCRGEPPLLHIDTWVNSGFTETANLFPLKIPRDFKGCPLVTTNTGGLDPVIVTILLKSLNITDYMFQYLDPGWRNWYYTYTLPNGSYSGLYSLLSERTVDLAGGSLAIGYDKSLISEHLPSHLNDYLTLFLPGPIPKSLVYGFVTCLGNDVWFATGISFLAVYLLFILRLPSATSASFVWLISRFTGLPYSLEVPRLLDIFGILLELMLLILTSLYRSSLLKTLLYTPMDTFQGPQDGIDRGLVTLLRPTYQYVYNTTHHELWNLVLAPGMHEMVLDIPYEKIVEHRTHMAMANYILDQSLLRTAYPNRSFQDIVTLVKPHYYTINMGILVPRGHPLLKLLTDRMTCIIESGVPSFLVELTLDQLPGKTGLKDSTRKPLALKHLITVLHLHAGLSLCAVVIFAAELLYYRIGSHKKMKNERKVSYLKVANDNDKELSSKSTSPKLDFRPPPNQKGPKEQRKYVKELPT